MVRRHARAAFVFLIVVTASPAHSENVCPPPNPPIADDEPRVREENFSDKRFAAALQYLREDFSENYRAAKNGRSVGHRVNVGLSELAHSNGRLRTSPGGVAPSTTARINQRTEPPRSRDQGRGGRRWRTIPTSETGVR